MQNRKLMYSLAFISLFFVIIIIVTIIIIIIVIITLSNQCVACTWTVAIVILVKKETLRLEMEKRSTVQYNNDQKVLFEHLKLSRRLQ